MKHHFRVSILFLLLFTLILSVHNSYGQCCSAGSPLGASSYGGIVEKNSFRLSTSIRYSQSMEYFTGLKKDNDFNPYFSHADFLFQGLSVAYGITKRLNVEIELGYFYYKTQYFKTDPPIIEKGVGLTNGIISAKYAIFKSKSKGLELTLGAGLKFPFSTKPQYDNIDIEPSTSAYGWMAQAIMQKEFKPKKITLILYSRYEQNSINDNNYKYGDRLRVSLIASKKIKMKYAVIIQTRYEKIGQDIRDKNINPSTGADLIFVSPQFLYSLKSKWNFILGVDLPVYKNYKGTQISNNYAVSLSLTHDLSLNKKPATAPN